MNDDTQDKEPIKRVEVQTDNPNEADWQEQPDGFPVDMADTA